MKRTLALAAFAATLLAGCASQTPQAGTSGTAASTDTSRHLRLAAAAERGGQPGMALSAYASAHEASPGDPDVAQRYATALVQAGQPQRAREVIAEARRRNPRNAALMQAEARALLDLGEAASALALFDAHLQAAPNDVRSLNGRGIALDLLGRHAEARMAYRAARQADPNSPVSAGNLALSLMLSGCADAAMAVLESAPRNAVTSAWLGEMQGLARTLSPSGTEDPNAAALRRAMPASSEPCAAAGPSAAAAPAAVPLAASTASDRQPAAAPRETAAAVPSPVAVAPAPASPEAPMTPVPPVQAGFREVPNGVAVPVRAATQATAHGDQVVARQDANIREAPSREAEVVRSVAEGTTLRAFQRSGSWVLVGNASPWGWMHASLLDAAG